MVGACITLAQSSGYQSVWEGNEPTDFGTDLNLLGGKYGTISATHSAALAATGGATDAKTLAETGLEDIAYLVARALAVHFKKTGDLDRRGKVDFSKSDLVRLRHRELIDQAAVIRTLAAAAVAEPGAAGRGVTAARLATLTAAIATFTGLVNEPRGQIVNRSTLLKEVETDTAALLEDLRDLDDLALQFSGTLEGDRFVQAWKRARIIVDAGHGPGEEEEEPPAPPVP